MNRCPASPLMLSLALGAIAGLTACSSKNESTSSTKVPDNAEKANAPLKPEQVNVTVKVTKGPFYDANADQLHVSIALVNNGAITLPVTGVNPVILGVVQKVPNANNLPDKRGKESRAPLPTDIGPTQIAEVEVSLPADFVVGNKVEFDALQEGVAWFGFSFDQTTAVIGPYKRCEGGTGICDSHGNPVAAL